MNSDEDTLFGGAFPHSGNGSDGETQQRSGIRTLIVETDGGSRGNPGHAGYGAVVRDPNNGWILAEKAGYLGKVSNNVAEYSGLVAGLKLVHDLEPTCQILVRMDSKLVVEQMSGRWKIKHVDMRKLATQARSLVDPRRVRYEWIPREKNKDADRLSNEAMDAGERGVEWVAKGAGVVSPPADRANSAGVDQLANAAAPGLVAPQTSAVSPGTSPVAPETSAVDGERAPATGRLHHVEMWVGNFSAAEDSWGWLLERLGYVRMKSWPTGASWQGAGEYIVIESGPDVEGEPHRRRRPGLNHLAFTAGTRADVDLLARRAISHGWSALFAEKYPHAGGPQHYAAYLENDEGFEVELVAY